MGLKPWDKSWLQDSAGNEMPVEKLLQLTGSAVTSLTDDPDNERTVAEIDGGGGGSLSVTDGTTTVDAVTELDFTSGATVTDGGGGIAQIATTTLSDFSDEVRAVAVNCPAGAYTPIAAFQAYVVDWFDATNGWITAPGLYVEIIRVTMVTKGTLGTGAYVAVNGAFDLIDMFPIDAFAGPAFNQVTPQFVYSDAQSLGAHDVPSFFGAALDIPAAATGWELNLSYTLGRLAYP